MTPDWISRRDVPVWSVVAALGVTLAGSSLAAGAEAPPGLFRDLDDAIVGDAIVITGKQLFIDDYIIEELLGAEKTLNQPVKHPRNPLIVRDKPSEGFGITHGNAIYDEEEGLYKMWYQVWQGDEKKPVEAVGALGYATSRDGLTWEKPIVNEDEQNNLVFRLAWIGGAGVFKDPVETDPQRRYKMLYIAKPDGTAKSLSVNAAYSPDGIHWTPEPENPLIPMSDSQECPFWDARRNRYVAYLRYGPPNIRNPSRIESEDFVHWSPKVTVLRPGKMDEPYSTVIYGMRVIPYAGVYVGLLTTYHGETIQPIPEDKLWMDRVNTQLAFSRNGVTWMRVGKHGVIPAGESHSDSEWAEMAAEATFIPYGEYGKDWDGGAIYADRAPLIVGDEIRIYYGGTYGRHWYNYHGDPMKTGIGLATLRLDGFVCVNAEGEGTLTTKPLVFIGDTIEINADAEGGSILVEALDGEGNVIEGFSRADCAPITTDSVRHVLTWRDSSDCHLIQARPIRLRFHLKDAKLYSFEPRIRHKHFVPFL